jgi:hypothetical protein
VALFFFPLSTTGELFRILRASVGIVNSCKHIRKREGLRRERHGRRRSPGSRTLDEEHRADEVAIQRTE